MDDKGRNSAGHDPGTISNDAVSRHNVSARTSASAVPAADDSAEMGSPDSLEPSSASEKARQLPGRMLVIAGAGLITWIFIAIGVALFFF